MLILFLMGCHPYVKNMKEIGIEHIYKNPNQAFGPVCVLMYSYKTDYEITCKPWEVLEIDEDRYYREELIKFRSTDYNIVDSTSMNLKSSLNAEELTGMESEYQNISEVKVELTNGQLVIPKRDYLSVIEKVIDPNGRCRKAYMYKHILHPNAKFYLVWSAFSYDFQTSIKIDDHWVLSTELPAELLKIISAKIESKYRYQLEKTMSGKGLYVGFNGDDVTPKTIKELMEIEPVKIKINTTGKTRKQFNMIDLTEIMKNL